MWTCRLMSSRAPNAPPTPPSTRRTFSSGQPEAGGDLLAVLVQPLGGDVQLDAAAVVVGHGQRRLEAEERLVLHADLVGALDHDVAGGVDVTATDALVAEARCRRGGSADATPSIAASASSSGSSTSYVDDDRGQRPPAGLGVVGGHGGDRLADVADDSRGEHRLVGGDQPVRELARARRRR